MQCIPPPPPLYPSIVMFLVTSYATPTDRMAVSNGIIRIDSVMQWSTDNKEIFVCGVVKL